MGWSRASGSPAMLPRTHPAPAPPLSLNFTAPSAPGTPYSESGFGPPYSPGPPSAARAAALAACASPRALGPDVPLLLSEQRSELMRMAPQPPPLAQLPVRAPSERRTRNSTAGMAALSSAEALNLTGMAADKAGQLPRNYSSFGADSKWGFEPSASESVFRMDIEGDMEL